MDTNYYNITVYESTANVYCSECGAEIGPNFIMYGEYGNPLCPLCYSKKAANKRKNIQRKGEVKDE